MFRVFIVEGNFSAKLKNFLFPYVRLYEVFLRFVVKNKLLNYVAAFYIHTVYIASDIALIYSRIFMHIKQ